MEIRAITKEDFSDLIALWAQLPGIQVRQAEDTYEGIGRILERNPDFCFLAEEHHEVIGSILCGYDGKRAYIYHLAVKQTYQKMGVASSLLGTAMQQLKHTGITKMSFVVFQKNMHGLAFWEHIGAVKRDDLHYFDLEIQ